jgi:hypothetical protein
MTWRKRVPVSATLAVTLVVGLACEKLNVTAIDVARIVIEPDTSSVVVGGSRNLVARALDASGMTLRDRPVVWSSSDPARALTDDNGRVTGVAPGSALISASSGTVTGSALVNVMPAPAIQLSPPQATLLVVQGSTAAAQIPVQITNGGGGALTGLSASVVYGSGQPTGWLNATLGGTSAPATLTLRGTAGSLAPGTYTAVVNLSSTAIGNPTAVLPVELQVAPRPPSITLGATTVSFRAAQGAADPNTQTVSITNSGGGSLTGLGASITYATGQPTDWLSASLSPSTAPSTLALSARLAGLSPGTYQATVNVTSAIADNSPRSIAVTLTVDQPPPAIALNRATVQFNATSGGANPGADSISVSNSGGGTLSGLTTAIVYGSGASAWLSASLNQTTAPAVITLRATTGALQPGTYTATLEVRSAIASNTPRTVAVTFIVGAAPQAPVITLSKGTVGFAAVVGGANPAADSVFITNSGGGSLTGLTTAIQYAAGQPTGWLTATLRATTAPTRVVFTATTSLLTLPGTYTATVEIRSTVAGNSPQIVSVTFQITAPVIPPAIGLSATTANFTATQGGSNPATQTISITNTGGGTLDDLTRNIVYTAGQPTGWLSTTLVSATAPTTLGLSATMGSLAAGTYTATVEVRSVKASNSPRTIAVTFQLNVSVPAAPTGMHADQQGQTSILVRWDDKSNNETSFRVERALASGGPWTIVATLAANIEQYLDTGLTRDTRYYYRVSACNAAGCAISPVVDEKTQS